MSAGSCSRWAVPRLAEGASLILEKGDDTWEAAESEHHNNKGEIKLTVLDEGHAPRPIRHKSPAVVRRISQKSVFNGQRMPRSADVKHGISAINQALEQSGHVAATTRPPFK